MIKEIWKDPVWSKVIATGILAIIASVGAYLLGIWGDIGLIISQSWAFICESTFTPNWLLGLMSIPCILIIVALIEEARDKFIEKEPVLSYKNYNKDEFFGLTWAWRYLNGGVDNLHSLCPHCEYQILPKNSSIYIAAPSYEYSCDDCNYSAGSFEGHPENINQRVKLKIQQNLRTGQWVKKQNT